jgi:hypothetical protein
LLHGVTDVTPEPLMLWNPGLEGERDLVIASE